MNVYYNIAPACFGSFKTVLVWLLLLAITQGDETLPELVIGLADQQLVFVRLPEQADINIGANTEDVGSVPVVATYMLKTELTAATLKALIGDEAYKTYLDGLLLGATQELEDHISHRKKLGSASPSIAACSIPMNLVFAASKKLKELFDQSGLISPVETVVVRLPTSTEWKYAATGRDSLSGMGDYPNFPSWPAADEIDRMVSSDETLRGYLSDLEEDDKDYRLAIIAEERGFMQALQRSSGDKSKLNGGKSVGQVLMYLLGRFLMHEPQLGLLGNPSVLEETKRDFDPSTGVANSFGLLNLFNNLSEWVMADVSDANAAWKDAVDRPADSALQFFAIGPSTFSQASYEGAWRWMSLNHPYPENDRGEQKSLSYDEASDPGDLEFFEGCRFLVVREMKENWFSTMRKSFLENRQDPAAFDLFADVVEKSIHEVLAQDGEVNKLVGYVDAYRGLANADAESKVPLSTDFFRMAEASSLPVDKKTDGQKQSKPKLSLSVDLGNFTGLSGSTLPKSLQKKKEKDTENSSGKKDDTGIAFFSIYRDLMDADVLQQ